MQFLDNFSVLVLYRTILHVRLKPELPIVFVLYREGASSLQACSKRANPNPFRVLLHREQRRRFEPFLLETALSKAVLAWFDVMHLLNQKA